MLSHGMIFIPGLKVQHAYLGSKTLKPTFGQTGEKPEAP
jgi:hypothetical protein